MSQLPEVHCQKSQVQLNIAYELVINKTGHFKQALQISRVLTPLWAVVFNQHPPFHQF